MLSCTKIQGQKGALTGACAILLGKNPMKSAAMTSVGLYNLRALLA